jgi:hypothetical protein
MMKRTKRRLLVPLVALSMTLAMAASANAQDRQYQGSRGTDVSLQITFGSKPHWVGIPGSQVSQIREGDRTDYDMFRYGRKYYAYNNRNDRWYMSRRWRGQFMLIDDRSVPRELRRIPREHWRNYPTAWRDRDYRDRDYRDRDDERAGGASATLRVTFGSAPHWAGINGTRVEVVPVAERSNYDVFRYGGTYYAYNSNQWYTSPRESGEFTMIDDRSVPSELSQVPREHWRSYPSRWGNPNGTPPGQETKNGDSPNGNSGHDSNDHSKDHGHN